MIQPQAIPQHLLSAVTYPEQRRRVSKALDDFPAAVDAIEGVIRHARVIAGGVSSFEILADGEEAGPPISLSPDSPD